MPPKKGPNTPPTANFGIAELRAGRKSWLGGDSGRPVHLRGDHGMPPRTMTRYSVTLLGKVLFGLNRFAFEVQEFDRGPEAVRRLLKKAGSEFADTYFGILIAQGFAPLSSLQVKFDDIEAIIRDRDMVTLHLKVPPTCYAKPPGENSSNPKLTKDLTCGAKTLQFKVGNLDTGPVLRSDIKCKVVDFPEVMNLLTAHSPRLRALFLGEPVPHTPLVITPQKKRKSDAPATIAKRLKKDARGKAGSAADSSLVDAEKAKLKLNGYVKSLADTVDADWHDSYEETGEMLQEWFDDVGSHVQNLLRVSVVKGEEFGQSHELLKQVADTWSNIQTIPFRGCPREDISNGEGVALFDEEDNEGSAVHCPDELVAFAWPALLARAAADESVAEIALLQMIKDACDHGVSTPHVPAIGEARLKLPRASRHALQQGRQRLSRLFDRKVEWSALPSTKKAHRMRRCIDRRFDGPKHLRTRDYDSDESW